MSEENEVIAPAYRQPWFWFLLAPLIASVTVGMTMLYLSIVSADGIVKEDTYKVGKLIGTSSEKTQRATELDLIAKINIDALTGDVMVQLDSPKQALPEFLQLSLIHPTHQKFDQTLTLRQLADTSSYTANLQLQLQKGKRYLILSDVEQSWVLRDEIQPPFDQLKLTLTADPATP